LKDEDLKVPASKPRIVACLDLLGTKNYLDAFGSVSLATAYAKAWSYANQASMRNTTLYEVSTPIDELDGFSEPITEYTKEIGTAGPSYTHLEQMVAFSDSLFLFGQDTSNESVADICDMANTIFQLFLDQELPISGAISVGECVLVPDKQIYVGMGIVKAYALQESASIVGIVCDPGIDPSRGVINRVVEVYVKPGKLLNLLRKEMTLNYNDKPCEECSDVHTWVDVMCIRKIPEHRKIHLDRNRLLRNFKKLRDGTSGAAKKRYINSRALVLEMLDAPYSRW